MRTVLKKKKCNDEHDRRMAEHKKIYQKRTQWQLWENEIISKN